MKALIDTNVMLDTILHREPFCFSSDKIFDLIKEEKIEGYVSVISLKDIFYFCEKQDHEKDPFETVEKLSYLFNIIDLNGADSLSALMSEIDDYEDGLLICSALRNGVDTIITRNSKDFFTANMTVIDPKDIFRYIENPVLGGETMIGNVF